MIDRVWSPAVGSMWSALRGSVVDEYSGVRESSSTAPSSSALHLQLYLLVYPTSDHAARVVLKRKSPYRSFPAPLRVSVRNLAVFVLTRTYRMSSSRLPPSLRSLVVVHRRPSVALYSSSPGEFAPALRRRASAVITVRVLYQECPGLPLPSPCALLPASCTMTAECKRSEPAVSAFDSKSMRLRRRGRLEPRQGERRIRGQLPLRTLIDRCPSPLLPPRFAALLCALPT